MAMDLSVELIHATVQLEQPLGDGTRTVGTGFLVSAPTPDGKPRTVLVTAGHVLDRMPAAEMRIGYREKVDGGSWAYEPQKVAIRAGSNELWTRNPKRDIAVMEVKVPPQFAQAAIPLDWLADDDAFERFRVGPGDEMMALGFPRGLSSNGAGFPILRSGKVASYPLGPTKEFPTFLLDFSVFPGNSGGPVFIARMDETGKPALLVAGMLTQQVELTGERLEIGIVTNAAFVRETIAMLDKAAPSAGVTTADATPSEGRPRVAFNAAMPAAQVSK
jgi:S1-C subfamily serine protease